MLKLQPHFNFIKNQFLKTKNILFHSFKDQVIFEKSEVMKSDGTPYTIFTPYSKIWKQKLKEQKIELFTSESLLNRLHKTKPFPFPSLNKDHPAFYLLHQQISEFLFHV